MLYTIFVKNYKSIHKVDIDVGTFNVLIGENGAGKSNFLEALASYSAIVANNFSNEFMLSRGIRVVEPTDIFSCFNGKTEDSVTIITGDTSRYASFITISLDQNEPFSPLKYDYQIFHNSLNEIDNDDFEVLNVRELKDNFLKEKIEQVTKQEFGSVESFQSELDYILKSISSAIHDEKNYNSDKKEKVKRVSKYINVLGEIKKNVFDIYHNSEKHKYKNFVVYSPELSSLRVFSSESQIEPLGVNGEGLLRLLQVMQEHEPENFAKVCKTVEMFQWVEKIIIDEESSNLEHRVKIVDRFMGRTIDHRSANEGFLFVLFYAALFSSKFTPQSFAVDNIDASLNPHLCTILIKELVALAKENGKQAFVTTHNPAILDGLNLHDDEQRLFVVERDDEGATQLRRVGIDDLPKAKRNGETIKLSESFMRGHLGGLPTNF